MNLFRPMNELARRRARLTRAAAFECAAALLQRRDLGALGGPPTRAERAEMALVFVQGGTAKAAAWTVLQDRQSAARRVC